jgi:hypothetical protein
MAKKAPKQLPHLRIRIEPKLLNRLEKSREKGGNTLTGEIVARLEQSFETEDRMAVFKEAMEKRLQDEKQRLQDSERQMEERVAEILGERDEMARKFSSLQRDLDEFNIIVKSVEQAERELALVDVLVGDDKLKSRLLRQVALEIINWPEDWATNPANREEIAARFRDALAQLGPEPTGPYPTGPADLVDFIGQRKRGEVA